MILFEAITCSELREVTAKTSVVVPMRANGREKELERYSTVHLMSALMMDNRIVYPVRLVKRERPDFMLSMGNRRIGIEHTEAIAENEAHKTVWRQKGYGPQTWYVSHVLPGEPKKKHKKLIQEIEANDPGDGWEGNSPEREWADAMIYSVKHKLCSVRKDGFDRFEEDWLIIYDNWSLPAPDVHEAAPFFFKAVQQIGALQEFQRIFVLRDQLLCEVSATGFKVYRTNDLWK